LADFLDNFPTASRETAVRVLTLAAEDLLDAVAAGRISAAQAPDSSQSA